MNKLNKKGFTLIEMLVVIAIIAVLVAIIIPTVSSSTIKAKAAADAANLRSVLAEATTELVSAAADDTGYVKYDAKTKSISLRDTKPACKSDKNWVMDLKVTNGVPTVTFSGITIAKFAEAAESGVKPTAPSKPTKP